jgi:hypothetical protein
MRRDFLSTQEGREKVTLKVVEREVRNAKGHGKPLGIRSAHQQCGSKSGAGCGCHGT